MAGELLLDPGGLVSLLDRRQRHHRSVVDYFQEWTGAVVSTEAVLTESTHLLGRIPEDPQACIEFFLRGGAVLVPSSGTFLMRAKRLIDQYSGLPMDYADATLVVLAEELRTNQISPRPPRPRLSASLREYPDPRLIFLGRLRVP